MAKKDIFTRYFDISENITKREKTALYGIGSFFIACGIIACIIIGLTFIFNFVSDIISFVKIFIVENIFFIKLYSCIILLLSTIVSTKRALKLINSSFNHQNSILITIRSEIEIFVYNYIAFFLLPILFLISIILISIFIFLIFLLLAIISDLFSIIDSFTVENYLNFLERTWEFLKF